jgi:hypothetical protein
MKYIIYETTNLINQKKYRGMHQTNNLEDGYLGSGTYLANAIKKYGKENFVKIILEFCESYDHMIEREKEYITDEWIKLENNYNLKTGGHSAGILSNESKLKISNTLKEKYKSGLINKPKGNRISPTIKTKELISKTLKEKYTNEIHPNTGKPSWNKGLKTNISSWNKGITGSTQSEKSNIKRSQTLKKRYETEKHPRKGKSSWCAGTKGIVKAWNKGLPAEKLICPHCGKLTNAGNLKRWHLNNCKSISNSSISNICTTPS